MDFCETLTDEQVDALEQGLNDFNASRLTTRDVVRVRAGYVDSGRVVAGVVGAAYWGKLHIGLLWVHSDYRSGGLGSGLMDWAEARGRELGCTAVVLGTMSFQGPEFYQRRGYRQFGLSDGYEGGARRHYLEKWL